MRLKKIIQVFEHEKLTLHDGRGLTQKHLDVLITYNDKFNSEYFTVIRDGIKFSQFVGVIQAGNLTIEILPKADKKEEVLETSKAVWHNVLLDMLKECRYLKVNDVDKALLNLKSNSLLEIYIQLFLKEAEQLLKEGLLKKYRKVQGNQLALKGQLQFAKNISQNLVHQERFYVRYTEYNHNNIFNQLLYKTIILIPLISNNPWIADKVNRLLLNFPEPSDIKVSAEVFKNIVFDRKTERYKEALLISKMLLLNFRPDITGGSENVIAILFDMNKLWEEFVYRRLKKEELQVNISVLRQQSKDFWQPESLLSKKIRPDIILKEFDKTIVIDTKWKSYNLTPADDDLKQMFVYNLYWKCDRSVLLYPASISNSSFGSYHHHDECADPERQCAIETVSVLNESQNGLNKSFGKNVLKTILHN